MGYSSFGFGPCLAEGVLCFELCEQRLTPPMSNSLFPFAGIKRCIFSVFLLGFRTFYPLHVLEPHKIIPWKQHNIPDKHLTVLIGAYSGTKSEVHLGTRSERLMSLGGIEEYLAY